ncbi:hypothetical protein [Dyella subtropica]|uniref:hypothetical protein n=1 Tax=Dyella subtropica TaxID=2992127 RepID=UPI00225BE429|nr:hypothetical protein [Dyella subtropica]
MSELLTLHEAIEAITAACDEGDGLDRYSWVYIRGAITQSSCRLYLASATDEEDLLVDQDGEALPPFAAEHQLHHYIEAAAFADVLRMQRQHQPLSDVADFAMALDHYDRFDVFLGSTPIG